MNQVSMNRAKNISDAVEDFNDITIYEHSAVVFDDETTLSNYKIIKETGSYVSSMWNKCS
jgi:hypothetical protein